MSIDIYDLYKPLRNYLRQFALIPSLLNLWKYCNHFAYGTPLPPQMLLDRYGRRFDFAKFIYPWDLEILTRELILNASKTGLTLANQWELGKAINLLRDLDNEMSKRRRDESNPDYVLFEIHRIGNRQFPFQIKPNLRSLLRHHKINAAAGVEPIVVEETGLNLTELFRLGLATTGSFQSRPVFNTAQDFSSIGISREKSNKFLSRLTCNIHDLKKELTDLASYDETWWYSWNPIVQKPLIAFDPNEPHLVVSPISFHLNNRFTKGLYYDIVNGKGFDNAYGNSFQSYVGEVLEHLCRSPDQTITPERKYYDGSDLKHGVTG